MSRSLSFALSLLLLAPSLIAANWTSSGPQGGVMLSLSASASNPRVVYAAGYGGVFRSDDNGETWRNVTGSLKNVTNLAADPGDARTAYAIAGNVFRTTDGGATWTPINTGLFRPNKVLIDPAEPKTVYVSGDCGVIFKTGSRHIGIAKSTDGGNTWKDATEGLSESGFDGCVVGLVLDPSNSQHLYARSDYAGLHGNWESLDGAATWSKTTALVPGVAIVADPASSRRFGTNAERVLASNDGGLTWNVQAGEGLPDSGSGPSVIDMTVDPSVPRLFGATSYGLFRSGDGGRSWLPVGDAPKVFVHSVMFNAADSTVMMATSEGLFRAPSPAFTPWKHLDVPENGIDMIADIAVDPQRPSVVFATSRDELQGRLFRSRDAGASWQPMTGPMSLGMKVSVDAGGDAWFGGSAPDATLYRIPSGKDEVIPVRQFGHIDAIAGSPTIPGRVYVSNGSVWRTDNGGANWIKCSEAVSNVTEIALNPSDPNLVHATAGFNGLWRSTDGCTTFQPLDAAPLPFVLHVVSAPSNPSVLYRANNVPFNNLRSDDGGATWTVLPTLTNDIVTKIAVDHHDPYNVWISFLNTGIRHSTDGGMNWKDASEGLPEAFHRAAFSMALDPTGTILHAGQFRSGIWELHITPARKRAVGR
jgi:photosystem II stability/assembly factor-like uncharacterized protein